MKRKLFIRWGFCLLAFLFTLGCTHRRDTVTRNPSVPEKMKIRLSKEERGYVRTDLEGREYYIPPSRVLEPKKR